MPSFFWQSSSKLHIFWRLLLKLANLLPMLKFIVAIVGLLIAVSGHAAEYFFDFSKFPINQCPTGYLSRVSGQGQPGDWKVITDDVTRVLTPMSSNGVASVKRSVLAQTAKDATDEHFPLLLLDGEEFSDFTLTTRFKIVSGVAEQMAGIAFRAKDEKNYYVIRFSALGNNFRFYKFVGGERHPAVGTDVQVPAGVWHELKLICKGNEIRCQLNGKECTPPINDTSFMSGKVGFWTKSDSVSHFVDAKIEYTPKVPFAKTLVAETLKEHSRLLGLKLYTMKENENPKIVACDDEKELGTEGGKVEADIIQTGHVYFAKSGNVIEVSLPLRDRNGDIAAAVKVKMKSFIGETEKNGVARAMPIRTFMEQRFGAIPDLMQ